MSPRLLALLALTAGCTVEVDITDGSDSEADAEDPGQIDQVAQLEQGEADAPLTADAMVADMDQDGIADTLEELLLRRYRPYFKFSKRGSGDESFRPADPVAEIDNAQLKLMDPGGDGTSDPLSGCGRASDSHLDPPESLYTCRSDSSWQVAQQKTWYCLNLANARYHGVDFAEAKANATGLYGHVVPTQIDGHDAYKIEYWQFFAFNNQDLSILGIDSFGDHEGDWTGVQLWLDRELHRITHVKYMIHGKQVTFAIPPTNPTCTDCTISVKGPNYNPNPPEFFGNVAAYSDNQAEFYIDAHHYKHVVVYIEHGAHEFWPGPWGHAQKSAGPLTFTLNPHEGDGEAYLAPAPARMLNMGEVAHPITRAGRLIMSFDGFWGCTNTKELSIAGPQRRSPVGPALHCEWTWPDRGAVAGCEH